MKRRYEIYHTTKAIAFGIDYACGEFLQIWDITKYREPDVDNILVDEDVKLTGLTRDRVLKILSEHGFTEEEMDEEYSKDGGL